MMQAKKHHLKNAQDKHISKKSKLRDITYKYTHMENNT